MNRTLLLVALLIARASPGFAADLRQPPPSMPADAPKLPPLLLDGNGLAITNKEGWLRQRDVLRQGWLAFLGELPRHKSPLRAEILRTEQTDRFTRQLVRYQIEDGVFADAYLLKPRGGRAPYPAVVVFHPTIATAADQVAGVDSSVPEKMQGVHLVQRGYVVLCPRCYIFDQGVDYAGHVTAMQARHPAWKGMTRMLWDGIRAADYLESLPFVDASRLGCLGHSLGAKEVLYAAAFDPRFQVAVFSEGGIGLAFSNWDAAWYLSPAIKKGGFPLEHHQLMGLMAPRAFLLLGGNSADGDQSWPFIEAVLPVYKLLGKPSELGWLNHRAGHRYPPEARQGCIKLPRFFNEEGQAEALFSIRASANSRRDRVGNSPKSVVLRQQLPRQVKNRHAQKVLSANSDRVLMSLMHPWKRASWRRSSLTGGCVHESIGR